MSEIKKHFFTDVTLFFIDFQMRSHSGLPNIDDSFWTKVAFGRKRHLLEKITGRFLTYFFSCTRGHQVLSFQVLLQVRNKVKA